MRRCSRSAAWSAAAGLCARSSSSHSTCSGTQQYERREPKAVRQGRAARPDAGPTRTAGRASARESASDLPAAPRAPLRAGPPGAAPVRARRTATGAPRRRPARQGRQRSPRSGPAPGQTCPAAGAARPRHAPAAGPRGGAAGESESGRHKCNDRTACCACSAPTARQARGTQLAHRSNRAEWGRANSAPALPGRGAAAGRRARRAPPQVGWWAAPQSATQGEEGGKPMSPGAATAGWSRGYVSNRCRRAAPQQRRQPAPQSPGCCGGTASR